MDNELIVLETESTALVETGKEKYLALESDLNGVQTNLESVAEKLSNQLPNIIDFADAAQHPKVYEALANMVKAISQVNRDTAAVIKQKQELYNEMYKPVEQEGPRTINNTDARTVNFVGTSTDLLKQVLSED